MSGEDDLYNQFVERYFETDEAAVPTEWPEEVRRRCNFFLQVVQAPTAGSSRSLLTLLVSEGIEADLSLSAPENQPPAAPASSGERYVVEKEIARGGMGRILLAYDRDFRRRIAMKVMLAPANFRSVASRFLEEAQATAQLEHPNIAPVYDLGIDDAGAPFFTMKWIRGRNLEDLLRPGQEQLSLVRRIQILQQAAMGVDFAHSRGVIHRDLKPQNIMVGDYGEVLVVDWGLAKVLGRKDDPAAEAVTTERAEKGAHLTIQGSVQGSLPYMAPEQARGEVDAVDARTDIYGLGAILYAIVTGVPPHAGSTVAEVLAGARRGDVIPPRRRAPERDIAPALEEICRKALSPRREDRFQSARELHDRLQDYIEGIHDAERRAAEAGRLMGEAEKLRARHMEAQARLQAISERESALRRDVQDHEPAERKQDIWAAMEEAQRAGGDAARLFSEATTAYHAVLSVVPGHPGAREALADLFAERMVAAEERGDAETTRLYEGFAIQYGGERHEARLHGGVAVRLRSDPPGAEVFLSRYEEKGPLLVESAPETAGATPVALRLAPGSYLAVLRLAGSLEARYPFLVERGAPVEADVRLYAAGTIPEGFVQVPAGTSIIGGEPRLFAALPRSRKHVPELFAARHPVTLGEYCEFLSDRLRAEAGFEAEADLDELEPAFGAQHYATRAADGRFLPFSAFSPRIPVMAINRASMLQYCSWLGRRLARGIRLLSEEEWERCARGADGRAYPWGNGFDWALCHGGNSRSGSPLPEPVGASAGDRSPFGIRDLAGCVREVCAGEAQKGYSPCRGGSWYIPIAFMFRADGRTMLAGHAKTTDVGFRVCYGG